MLYLASACIFVFCSIVIFVADNFTYNGTSALLLGLNLMIAAKILFLRTDS